MDVDGLWLLVERARAAAGSAADRAREGDRPSRVAEALVAELTRLPLTEIVTFDRVLGDLLDQADTWDLCASCWVVQYGFLSDDGFSAFRAGLVGMGRAVFEAVVGEPDLLAGHPAVKEIGASDAGNLWIGDEELLFAASEAYVQRTGDSDVFWDAVAAEQDVARPTTAPKPTGARWDLRSEAEWRNRLPRLAALLLARRIPPR